MQHTAVWGESLKNLLWRIGSISQGDKCVQVRRVQPNFGAIIVRIERDDLAFSRIDPMNSF